MNEFGGTGMLTGPLIVMALGVALATLLSPRIGVGIMVFAIILSPELQMGQVYFRAEDILIIVVGLAWVALTGVEARGIVRHPLNAAISFFVFWNLLSMLNNFAFGNPSPLWGTPVPTTRSVLFFLKKVEYFIVFFLVANVIKNYKQVRTFIWLMLAAVIVVSGYAIYDSLTHGVSVGEPYRAAAPFDPEPNTFGQYLMLHIIIILCLLRVFPLAGRLTLLGLLGVAFVAFMFTYSRGGYFALLISVLLVGLMVDRRVLIGWLVAIGLATAIFPQSVIDRVSDGFREISEWRAGTAEPGANAFMDRVESFEMGLRIARDKPFFGAGPGTVPLAGTEAQLPREAIEAGFPGLALFLWVLFEVLRLGWTITQKSRNPFSVALGQGLFIGTIAYLISGFSAIPFTTIRTAMPYWLYVGLCLVAYKLETQRKVAPRFVSFEAQREREYEVVG